MVDKFHIAKNKHLNQALGVQCKVESPIQYNSYDILEFDEIVNDTSEHKKLQDESSTQIQSHHYQLPRDWQKKVG